MNYLFICTTLIGINPGDLLVTRNFYEQDNRSPGWWNHAAIYVGNNMVIEAQEGRGVIATSFNEFYNRYPYILVLRSKQTCNCVIFRIINLARIYIGKPYARYASFWILFIPNWGGENCISLVRKCYSYSYGFDFGWTIPDDLVRDWRLKCVEVKGFKIGE